MLEKKTFGGGIKVKVQGVLLTKKLKFKWDGEHLTVNFLLEKSALWNQSSANFFFHLTDFFIRLLKTLI